MSRLAQSTLYAFLLGAVLALAAPAHATIGLVVGEPFGSFGTMMPVGHASIYLDHLCTETPTQLRPCRPGELGVVLSRYHDLRYAGLDWMAVPASVFFYGVEDPTQTPTFMTASLESELREQYRADHLQAVAPVTIDRHGNAHRPSYGDWEEAIGASFDRRLFVYTLDTTTAQDEAILRQLNNAPNRRRYSLGRANCADFANDILGLVLPAQLPRNVLGDFDMTTPKNLARELDIFGSTHSEIHLNVYEVPQIPGTLRRSRPLRGSAETFVKTKRYLVTVLVLQPELIATDWLLYETKGKWTPGRDAVSVTPANFAGIATYSPDSTSSNTFSEGIGLRAK